MNDCERVRRHFGRYDAICCKACHEHDDMHHVRAKRLGPLSVCCHALSVVIDLRHDGFDLDPEDPPSFMMRAARAV